MSVEETVQSWIEKGSSPQEAEKALQDIYGIKLTDETKNKNLVELILERTCKDKNKVIESNPVIDLITEDWRKYGFKSRKEADDYVWGWLFYNALIGHKQYTLKGISTPEELLEKFPLEKYRQNIVDQ